MTTFEPENVSVSEQPPPTTGLPSANQRTASAPNRPIRAAASRTTPPSTSPTLCCCWVSSCWESVPFPSSLLASPTLMITPARRTHLFTSVQPPRTQQINISPVVHLLLQGQDQNVISCYLEVQKSCKFCCSSVSAEQSDDPEALSLWDV